MSAEMALRLEDEFLEKKRQLSQKRYRTMKLFSDMIGRQSDLFEHFMSIRMLVGSIRILHVYSDASQICTDARSRHTYLLRC